MSRKSDVVVGMFYLILGVACIVMGVFFAPWIAHSFGYCLEYWFGS